MKMSLLNNHIRELISQKALLNKNFLQKSSNLYIIYLHYKKHIIYIPIDLCHIMSIIFNITLNKYYFICYIHNLRLKCI